MPNESILDFDKIRKSIQTHLWLWLVPTVAFGLLSFVFAVFRSDTWQASQTLMVRDEAIGELGFGRLGRFDSTDHLQQALETILQIAKNKNVVSAALAEIGPPSNRAKNWPTDDAVEAVQNEINVSAPKGAEFGKTEVFYLSVTGRTPQQAVALNAAVCNQLERRMQQLRDQNAQSVVAELSQKVKLAEHELNDATKDLSALEQALGSDLGEMRTLAEAGAAGDSSLRRLLNQIKVESRQAEANVEEQDQLLQILRGIHDDTDAIAITPNRLLDAQPALRRLKDGLVDAQLRTATLQGTMSNDHPQVRAALISEGQVRDNLQRELSNAIRGIEADMSVSSKLVESLNEKLQEVQTRLDHLASLRTRYANLVANVEDRRGHLRDARIALTEARARQDGARASSLIIRLDQPDPGSHPVGPGRMVIIGAGTMGGMAVGLSLMFLVTPWSNPSRRESGRRWTDRLPVQFGRGRRATDQIASHGATEPADGLDHAAAGAQGERVVEKGERDEPREQRRETDRRTAQHSAETATSLVESELAKINTDSTRPSPCVDLDISGQQETTQAG